MSSVTITSNISSLKAQRQLVRSSEALSSTFAKLSSGQRINKASDDAAGLAIASSLKSDSRVYTQAIRNVSDGVSMLNVAEGALQQLSSITIRQRELAEQSANGVYSNQQRSALNSEANALVDEFNRIVQTSSFNGVKLLDGSLISGVRMQAGYGSDGGLAFTLGNDLGRTIGTGSFTSGITMTIAGNPFEINAGDVNGDGNIDLVTASHDEALVAINYGNGDGTFKARITLSTNANPRGAAIADLNGDGLMDIAVGSTTGGSVILATGGGNFASYAYYSGQGFNTMGVTVADFDQDGDKDLGIPDYSGTTVSIYSNNGNGTFRRSISYEAGNGPWNVVATDFNNDGKLDLVASDTGLNAVSILAGNGDGTFRSPVSWGSSGLYTVNKVFTADFDGDGNQDLLTNDGAGSGTMGVLLGNGDGTFKAQIRYTAGVNNNGSTIGDYNGDGYLDVVTANGTSSIGVVLGNGDGTFKVSTTIAAHSSLNSIINADFNKDGVLDVAGISTATGAIQLYQGNTTKVTTIARLNLRTQSYARDALQTTEQALNRITAELGTIGAAQARLEIASNNLRSSRENFDAAGSRIIDADISQESAELTKNTILQQAVSAVLAQANQQPRLALQLLNG